MSRYVTDDLKIMTKKAIADVVVEDEDGFSRNLKYILEHLRLFDIEIYAKFLFSKLVCVKENAKNDIQTDLRKIDDMQAEINRLREVIRLARDTAYQATQDCPRCGFIDDVLTKTLNSENIKDDDK